MIGIRHLLTAAWLVAATAAHVASAQQDTDSADRETQTPASELEEIVVRPERRSGDPGKIDTRYEDILRTRLFAEFRLLREQEERERFREKLPKPASSGRVSWGYDPAAELRMRRDTELIKLDGEPPRAPTQFRVEF